MTATKRLIVGISGASGVIYGIKTLQMLQQRQDVETHLIITATAKMNISIETDWNIKDIEGLADTVHNINDISASIASGSFQTDGMLVAPCSMRTLSAITYSFADNLLVRAADVTLKEGRKLVLMPREMPLHTGHCKLLYEASQIGIHIAPPMPAFYNKPQTVDDIVTYTVGRTLDLFDLEPGVIPRWQGPKKV